MSDQDLVLIDQAPAELAPAQPAVTRYLRAARSPSTWRRYAVARRQWWHYCVAQGWDQTTIGPERCSAWFAHLADSGRSWATIQIAVAALRFWHPSQRQVLDDPLVRTTLEGIARVVGTAPRRQARDLSPDDVRRVLAPIGHDSLTDRRDRALIAIWWLSACRSAEIAALDLADVDWRPEGCAIRLRRSKTDQLGAGRSVAIPAGPATEALRAWTTALRDYGIQRGPLWRRLDGGARRLSAQALVAIVSRRADTAGIAGVTGHSLRRGHVTSAALLGVPLPVIAQQTGHRSLDTVLRYCAAARLFDHTSARGLL